jgi:hypothetical protein
LPDGDPKWDHPGITFETCPGSSIHTGKLYPERYHLVDGRPWKDGDILTSVPAEDRRPVTWEFPLRDEEFAWRSNATKSEEERSREYV